MLLLRFLTSIRVILSPSLTLVGVLLERVVPLSEDRFVPRFVMVISSPFEVSWTTWNE